MPSKYADILADIVTRLKAIAEIGVVYDYERFSSEDGKFIELFGYTLAGQKQVRGWEITRTAVSEHKDGAFFRHHQFRINGYMGLKDSTATEKIFQTLIESICEAFRAVDPSAGQTWYYMNGDDREKSAAQVNGIGAKQFGNILCHTAEINLSVTERIVA